MVPRHARRYTQWLTENGTPLYGSLMNQSASERTAGAVRAELARRRISGRELAQGLDWSVGKTWRRLSGEHPLDIDELDAIARYLAVPVASLIPAQQVAA